MSTTIQYANIKKSHSIQDNDLLLANTLSEHDIELLKRLPSVRERNIDIEAAYRDSQVVVLKNSKTQKIELLTFYHNFGDFVYPHTTIGRDQYKFQLFEYLLSITTTLAPTYFVILGSDVSIDAAIWNGAEEVFRDSVARKVPEFTDRLNTLMGTMFYWDGLFLRDLKDETPITNPVFRVTKDSFKSRIYSSLEH
ncbi:MAG: hypothetical protein OCC49_19485 [Fibrobacterales bacterium]